MKKAVFSLLIAFMLIPSLLMAQKPTKAGAVVVEEATACDSLVWERNGQVYTESGVFNYTLADTTYVLNLTIGLSTEMDDEVVASCDYAWQGETFVADTMFTKKLTSMYGCDSVVTLKLSLTKEYRDTLVVTTCHAFTFRESTYDVDGVYSDTVHNEDLQCDSIFSLNLSMSDTMVRVLDEKVACSRYTWTLNGDSVYTASTTDEVLIATDDVENQCDTLYRLTITIGEPVVDSNHPIACRQFTWDRNDSTYTESTVDTYMYTAESDEQCDTLFVIDLSLIDTLTFETIDTICGAYMWTENADSIYHLSTRDTVARLAAEGTAECDSLFLLDLTIFEKFDTVTARVCDMYTFTRHYADSTATDTARESGLYYDTIIAENGCVTNRVYDLDITPTRRTETEIDTARCRQLSLFFNRSNRDTLSVGGRLRRADERITVTEDGTEVRVRYSRNTAPQCFDSLIVVNVTINKISYDTRTPEVISSCGEYKWNTTRRKLVDSTHFGGLDSISIVENVVDALSYVVVDDDTLRTIYLTTDTAMLETEAATLGADTIILLTTSYDTLTTADSTLSTDTIVTTINAMHVVINDSVKVVFASDSAAAQEDEQLVAVAMNWDTILTRVGGIDTVIEVFDSVHRTYAKTTRDSVEVGVNEFGCDVYHVVKVNIYSNPIVSISGDFKVKDQNDVAEIYAVVDTAKNIRTYEWSGDYTTVGKSKNNDTIRINGIKANTDVTLKITDKHGCSAESWITILYGVGIADVQNVNFSIYPNPTAQIINLKADEAMNRVVIYNTVGVQVINKTVAGNEQSIDLSGLPQGAYTMRVELANGETMTRRFIKSK